MYPSQRLGKGRVSVQDFLLSGTVIAFTFPALKHPAVERLYSDNVDPTSSTVFVVDLRQGANINWYA